jgi:hypothetical protein
VAERRLLFSRPVPALSPWASAGPAPQLPPSMYRLSPPAPERPAPIEVKRWLAGHERRVAVWPRPKKGSSRSRFLSLKSMISCSDFTGAPGPSSPARRGAYSFSQGGRIVGVHHEAVSVVADGRLQRPRVRGGGHLQQTGLGPPRLKAASMAQKGRHRGHRAPACAAPDIALRSRETSSCCFEPSALGLLYRHR